jgi:hypothetical protein
MGDRTAIETPVIFAGILLGETSMLNLTGSVFRMTNQTYYYNDPELPATDPSGNPIRGVKRWATNDTVMWRQKKLANGTGEYEHVNPADWDNFTKYPHFANYSGTIGANKLESYRNCCGTGYWPGIALGVMFLPGGREAWDHPAFFDYVDRVHKVPVDPGWQPFIGNMWNTYRSQVTALNDPTGMEITPKVVLGLKHNPHSGQNGPLLLGLDVPEDQDIRVSVHKANGEEIALLYDRPLNAGRHGLVWDNPKPGIHCLRISTPTGDTVKKVTILK